jgi:oxidase EvaA
VLRHESAGYFEVVGFTDANGEQSLLIRQSETALVGLITHTVGNKRWFLLNARCEPGLHGLCQFSTTVQSTPSNYEQRHGGAATPFIDLLIGGAPKVAVLHDSIEFDWGQYYDSKRKRFLVIEVEARMPVVEPFAWVPEALLRELLREDYLVTGDLRGSMALLDAGARAGAQPSPDALEAATVLTQTPLGALSNWVGDEWGLRERVAVQELVVEYVRIESSSREVVRWSQPLLKPAHPENIRLWMRTHGGVREVAVETRSQLGLRGRELLFPAQPSSARGKLVQRTRTSAEGGRFLDHDVVLELAELDEVERDSQLRWVDEQELARLLLSPQLTSVELRLVASLLDEGGW